jgi:ATP-dependent RNA helicase DeaD
MERFRIEVGYDHGVKPGNIVGAVANEAGLDGKHVGSIEITETHSFIDLPKGMPKDIFKDLKKVWVCGQQLKISRVGGRDNSGDSGHSGDDAERPPKKRKKAAGKKTAGKKPARKKSGGKKPVGKKPAGKKPAGKKPARKPKS